jgi:hypothetical protein
MARTHIRSVRCLRPDDRYFDPRSRRTDLVRWEEPGTLWLWAWPELLGWPTGISWLFSPPTDNRRWPGDLWGVDDAGELVIVETKRTLEPADPFQDFVRIEQRRSLGSWIPPTLDGIRAYWEPRLLEERQFLEQHYGPLLTGSSERRKWRGIVPYSVQRLAVWRWRTVYLQHIAPMIAIPAYEDLVLSRLEKWAKRTQWSPHYLALFTVVDAALPRFSRKGQTNFEELVSKSSADHVHIYSLDCNLVSETEVSITCCQI